MLAESTPGTGHMQTTQPEFEFKAMAKVIGSGPEKPGSSSHSHLCQDTQAVSRYLIVLVSSIKNLVIIIVPTS